MICFTNIVVLQTQQETFYQKVTLGSHTPLAITSPPQHTPCHSPHTVGNPLPPSLPLQVVCCDPDRLRGVLLNLYTNASVLVQS